MRTLFGFLALALAIGLGAVAVADGIRERNDFDVLSVTGSARQQIVSDHIIWEVSVSSQRETSAAAARELAGWARQVRGFLADEGARAEEITTRPISTETVEDDNGEIVGRRLTRSFEVRSNRVEDIARIAERASTLLTQNIPVDSFPPQYIYTKLASLRPQLIAAATKDALARAKVLVDATDSKLGSLRSVNVGVFQVTAPNSTEVSDYGVYDTTTLRKDVTAVVNVSFGVR